MRAGRLRHRLQIQAPPAVPTRDSTGAEVEVWQDVAEVWGSREPYSGREYWAAAQVHTETSHRIGLRYRSDITSVMRIVDYCCGSLVLNIRAVLDREGRKRELEIVATEKV